jgi:hypothetical protein
MPRSVRVILVGAALVTGSLLWTGGAAAAGPPEAVTITSLMGYDSTGDFHATGDAVASGLVCSSGTVEDWEAGFRGSQSERVQHVWVIKQFVCDDGSGTFMVRLEVHQDLVAVTEWFSWRVLSGTDAYRSLHGAGLGTTDFEDFFLGPWDNTYTGFLVG